MSRRALGLVAGGLATVLAVALLFVTLLGEGERGGAVEHDATASVAPARQAANSQVRFNLSVTPEAPAVGEIATLAGGLVDAQSGQPVRNVRYEVTAQHLEDDVGLFTARFASLDGTFSWGYHFWDGVEYELRITATPLPDASVQFAPLAFRGPLHVTPVAPPVLVQLRSLFYLVALTGIGLVLGLASALRRPARSAIHHPTA